MSTPIINIQPRTSADDSIGNLLLQAGKIRVSDVQSILSLQNNEELRFGEAAVKLGLVTEATSAAYWPTSLTTPTSHQVKAVSVLNWYAPTGHLPSPQKKSACYATNCCHAGSAMAKNPYPYSAPAMA